MDKNILDMWLKALRSGDYEQGGGWLEKDNRFCCLGVLANEMGYDGLNHIGLPGAIPQLKAYSNPDMDTWPLSCGNPKVTVTQKEREELVFRNNYAVGSECCLSALNDNGLTFKEIADIIERNADKI